MCVLLVGCAVDSYVLGMKRGLCSMVSVRKMTGERLEGHMRTKRVWLVLGRCLQAAFAIAPGVFVFV